MEPAERVIVALDADTTDEAKLLINGIPEACRFKFHQGFLWEPDFRELILDYDFDVLNKQLKHPAPLRNIRFFADTKYHDIPNTVEREANHLRRHFARNSNIEFITVHGIDGREVEAAAKAVLGTGIKVLVVPLLTSAYRLNGDFKLMLERITKASAYGADGTICAPFDVAEIRKFMRPDFLIVTPGIRPDWSQADEGRLLHVACAVTNDDQLSVGTPGKAIADGADYIVVGRPITQAIRPREAFLKIVDEVTAALNKADEGEPEKATETGDV